MVNNNIKDFSRPRLRGQTVMQCYYPEVLTTDYLILDQIFITLNCMRKSMKNPSVVVMHVCSVYPFTWPFSISPKLVLSKMSDREGFILVSTEINGKLILFFLIGNCD